MSGISPSRISWLLRRLSLMSAGEILHRTRKEFKQRFEARKPVLPPLANTIRRIKGNEAAPIGWLLDLSKQTEIRSVLHEKFHWSDAAARTLMAHRFSFFSFDERDFGKEIQWNMDYLNGITTPMSYGPMLDYRDNAVCGDIKYVWEHNRHHHLVELAKAAYLTGDERYTEEILRQISSWIDACPYPRGVQWASSLESAIRVINWCFCLQFLQAANPDFATRHAEFMRRWIASVYEHLKFIVGHMSRYSSANNHLIGEAAGLFFGSVCFRFPESGAWAHKARRILEEEALKQNWPDGVNKEQAISYQAFVFDFLLYAALLGRKNGFEFREPFWERLERMAEFVAALIDERGDVPRIGDDDDGYVVILSRDKDFKLFRSLLATAAALFDRRDFQAKAGTFDEKSFWLLGFGGRDTFNHASRTGDQRKAFTRGGYILLHAGSTRVVFDCGPLGYTSLAAHGHADALSIVVDAGGRSFLVDPGTYAYHTHREWRNYFRGTAAHNTIRIDGQDQSVIGGNFMWLRKARTRLLGYDALSALAVHDGYTRLGVVHERNVRLSKNGETLLVTDTLRGKGTHTVQQFFHLSPECDCSIMPGGFRIRNGDVVMTIMADPAITQSNVRSGSIDPIAGWYSWRLDCKAASPTICFEVRAQVPLTLTTRIEVKSPIRLPGEET